MATERYAQLLFGNVKGLTQTIAGLRDGDGDQRAWARVLQAGWAAAEPNIQRPQPAECEHSQANPQIDGHLVCLGLRHALATFDAPLAKAWVEAGERLECPKTPESRLAHYLRSLEAGQDHAVDLHALRMDAVAAGDACTVVGVGVAQAWRAELAGDHRAALVAARRASRMARTEAIPQQEYLANIVLARCRRLNGHPHLAVRILRALESIASVQWRPWIAWELALAGALEHAARVLRSVPDDSVGGTSTRLLLDLLSAAKAGQKATFCSLADALNDACHTSMRLCWDAKAVLGSLGGRPYEPQTDCETGQAQELTDWLAGRTPSPPRGIHGVAAATMDEGETQTKALAFVIVDPPADARRVLIPGTSLLGERYTVIKQSQRRQGRLDTALSVLALAGKEGLAVNGFFAQVYGFSYKPRLHADALRKVLSRVDEWLGEHGTVEGDENRRWLVLRGPILVADPRCTPSVDTRVLGALVDGSTSARETALRLSIPLRTAQAALKALVAEGACQRVRKGNKVEYHVEDTTFSEPTLH